MVGAVALEVALTLVFSILLSGVFMLFLGTAPVDAFVREGPQLLIIGMGIGFLAWLVLLIVGLILNRNRGWRIRSSLIATVLALVINLIGVSIIGFTGGGWSALIIVFAIEAGAAFLIASITAALIVHLKVLKRKPEPEVAPSP
jgi:hypothetical protein